MTRASLTSAIVVGAVITALFWIDPIFIPLALLGPIVTGVVLRARNEPVRWGLVAWAVAGVGAVISDFVVNHEDVVFHLVLTVLMLALVGLGWAMTAGVLRFRTAAA